VSSTRCRSSTQIAPTDIYGTYAVINSTGNWVGVVHGRTDKPLYRSQGWDPVTLDRPDNPYLVNPAGLNLLLRLDPRLMNRIPDRHPHCLSTDCETDFAISHKPGTLRRWQNDRAQSLRSLAGPTSYWSIHAPALSASGPSRPIVKQRSGIPRLADACSAPGCHGVPAGLVSSTKLVPKRSRVEIRLSS
jgi:hypothetical protein